MWQLELYIKSAYLYLAYFPIFILKSDFNKTQIPKNP